MVVRSVTPTDAAGVSWNPNHTDSLIVSLNGNVGLPSMLLLCRLVKVSPLLARLYGYLLT
jgi:hypothetical protein